MNKGQIGNIFLVLILGLFVGAISGILLDRIFGIQFFSVFLFAEPFVLELYIIKVGIQLTPASIIGLVVSGYLVLKRGT
ncbi:hypothetical protein O4O04_15715 [Leptospira sp. GIMC2001]|nr:hypothetical protein [Leptospira sp. GIMC2001]WCL48737.1 hypothetical protein O4O04_15715 [Leptospira sp. GIMC2001]